MNTHSTKIFSFAFALVSLLPLSTFAQNTQGSVVVYQTTFDNLSAGAQTVVGTDGWLANPSPGPHGTSSFFPGQGLGMYVGGLPFSVTAATFARPINYDPVAADKPVVHFSTNICLTDSTNGFRDDFGFQIHNSNGEVLARLIFDNAQAVVRVDNGTGPVSTGVSFPRDNALQCEIEIDFADNAWTVTVSGTEIISYQTFNATGKTRTLGDVAIYWAPNDPSNPGDNQLLLDNYSLIASPYTSRASNGLGILIPESGLADPYPSDVTITGLTGGLNRLAVRLDGFDHASLRDVSILLVAPDGRGIVLLSEVGGASNMSSRTVFIDDLAPAEFMAGSLPLRNARYQPTASNPNYSFPAPAPQCERLTTLSEFYGMDPNGTWKLFILDDQANFSGQLTCWGIEFGTDSRPVSYANWQTAYFSSEAISSGMADVNADPDVDGISNLFEYAFSTNPMYADSNSNPNAPKTSLVTINGGTYLSYEYLRDANKVELQYTLEVSSNMVDWTPFTGVDTVVDQVGYVEKHQALLSTDSGSNTIRLRITVL